MRGRKGLVFVVYMFTLCRRSDYTGPKVMKTEEDAGKEEDEDVE
jgi:hypothetical protein